MPVLTGVWVSVLLLAAGLVLIVKGGDWFLDGAVWMAEASGVPRFLIGATVVSLATTLPELTVSLTGVLRGLIREGYPVTKGLKIADIDPRPEQAAFCDTVSDKARSIGGGVVEALLFLSGKKNLPLL